MIAAKTVLNAYGSMDFRQNCGIQIDLSPELLCHWRNLHVMPKKLQPLP